MTLLRSSAGSGARPQSLRSTWWVGAPSELRGFCLLSLTIP